MKILIGILKVDEPQFDALITSIKDQLSKGDDTFVLEGYSKHEAHDLLFRRFTALSSDFDIFLKMDADMIIERDDFLSFIRQQFNTHKGLDWLHLHIWDSILGTYISGLNAFSNRVRWSKNSDNLFTDRKQIASSIQSQRIIDEPTEKWVSHCKNATFEQAYNFGSHRAVKAFQFGVKATNRSSYSNHGIIFQQLMLKPFGKAKNSRRIAALGFLDVLKDRRTDQYIHRKEANRIKRIEELKSRSTLQMTIEIFLSFQTYILLTGKIGYHLIFRLSLKN